MGKSNKLIYFLSGRFRGLFPPVRAVLKGSIGDIPILFSYFRWSDPNPSGVPFSPDRIALNLNGVPIYREGSPVGSTRKRAEKAMKEHDLRIEVDLASGRSQACIWTCDLSHEYVDINGSYIS